MIKILNLSIVLALNCNQKTYQIFFKSFIRPQLRCSTNILITLHFKVVGLMIHSSWALKYKRMIIYFFKQMDTIDSSVYWLSTEYITLQAFTLLMVVDKRMISLSIISINDMYFLYDFDMMQCIKIDGVRDLESTISRRYIW